MPGSGRLARIGAQVLRHVHLDMTMSKLWGGRFTDRPDDQMRRFGDSIDFDIRLWEADIMASIA